MERQPGAAGGNRLSDEAYEVSELLVRVQEAARASQVPGAPRPAPMSPHAIRAAIHLAMAGSETVGQLARGLGISVGWASRIANEMEGSGHVLRERSTTDRRVVRLRLSPTAERLIAAFYAWRGDAVERALGELDPRGRDAVRTFLRRVAEEFERGPATVPAGR
jgi:DNA-binding MarR family transcriptional regulator